MIEKLIEYRRNLHMIPELDKDLPRTFMYIKEKLETLSCKLMYPDTNAIAAYFDFGREETLAYRSDMDALAIKEKTTHEYKSTHDGKMHGCGHDGHMAMLLVFAEYLDELKEQPKNNVMLIFQPAEETTGGAKDICESGIFEKYNIKRTYGCHLWPDLPKGVIGARAGGMMSKCSEVVVEIEGLSTHIAKASEGRDAMVAGAKFILDAYEMEREEVSPEVFRLLKFGKMTSGSVGNAISAYTYIKGSLRAFDMDTFNFMKDRLRQIAEKIEKETGCKFTIAVAEGYPPVINDEELFNSIKAKLSSDITVLPEPSMTGEDFSFYGEKGESFFFFLGIGTDMPLHADNFDFDEGALERGVEFYKKLLIV